MHRKVFLALAMVCCLSSAAYAVPTVTAGDWVMNQGSLGNPISILISGGDLIEGLNMRLAIGDELSPNQPIIASVDIVGPGTVFNGNNTGQVDSSFLAPGLRTNSTTTTASGTVVADGTLAFFTIDIPVGVAPGVYRLGLTYIVPPPFATNVVIATTLVDGTITVPVPEPTSIVLGLFAAGGLCAVAIRRRRRKAA